MENFELLLKMLNAKYLQVLYDKKFDSKLIESPI